MSAWRASSGHIHLGSTFWDTRIDPILWNMVNLMVQVAADPGAAALEEKPMSSVVKTLRSLFSENGKCKEINADGEFDNPTSNQLLSKNNVTARYKDGRQDLATIDAAMNTYKTC